MKIFDLLESKNLSWTDDSCDVWIDPAGKIYDLGFESCHLQFIKENFDNTKYSNDLIQVGWIRISNTKRKVSIDTLNESFEKYKKNIILAILEKAKTQEFELELNCVNTAKKLDLILPKDQSKFIAEI